MEEFYRRVAYAALRRFEHSSPTAYYAIMPVFAVLSESPPKKDMPPSTSWWAARKSDSESAVVESLALFLLRAVAEAPRPWQVLVFGTENRCEVWYTPTQT